MMEMTQEPVSPVSEPVAQKRTDSLEEVSDTPMPEEVLELLAFRLADEEYAVNLLKVREIIRLPQITPVPRTPNTIKGIISLRGTIIPVFDLRACLGLPESQPDRKTRILVIVISKGLMGLIVDEVTEVVRLKTGEIEPPPLMVGESGGSRFIGVAKYKGRLLILLDPEKALFLGQP